MGKFASIVGLTAMVGLLASPADAQQTVTTDQIVQSLKPKPRTRGAGTPSMTQGDAAFIQTMKLKTRGLTIEERERVSTIVSTASLPSIDLEVNFALNSARLEPASIETLSKLGTALRTAELADASFLIAGYTDGRGAQDYNQKLSEERAATVRSYLAANFQIASSQLLAVGYGQEHLKNSANPFADENRRVKITNLGK